MRAWPGPELPELPGTGSVPSLHDSASGARRLSAGGGEARMYVCGITPYDAAHLGHAFTYVAFDLLHRAWRDAGLAVRYVQNVTDVDDPLLERARRDGQDWRELAERETERFRDDMAALRVLPPTAFVGAVEAVPRIAAAVQELRSRGAAYDVDDDVYFPVSADPRFGSVSRLGPERMLELFAERGGDPDRTGKKDPLDALLWRAERPGEPAWDSPVGRGRPGWHVECTAIALEHLGASFDVQGGGSDLTFPHHEMGAAHGQVLSGGTPFAGAYAHAGMVGFQGAKMSKSRGNLVFVSALRRDGVDPLAIRLALLAHPYRSDWEWTDDDLVAGSGRLARWRAAVARPDGPPAAPVLGEVRARLADDLDAPGALR
ncbi:MAG: cysteine--1-D-myo-inosityl 2-amino-2-deoxy-alpha-D-glucopyranoside ligase, partial [Actinomycetota bacterium]|nr:cysteine--1-D-myo-inosityl 2-amino-2-deoxy-alpha-D-glucopyranoside ligase [Actinomycetota bacterium]